MLMVKPGLAYLDIIKQTKEEFPEYPLFVYQVRDNRTRSKETRLSFVSQLQKSQHE